MQDRAFCGIVIGGGYCARVYFSYRRMARRKERIRKEKLAATLFPLARHVALHFIDEYETNLVDISDPHLLGLLKKYGSDKSLKIAAKYANEDIWDFISHINHDVDANRITVKISDLLVDDDFANQVVELVKKCQYLHIK